MDFDVRTTTEAADEFEVMVKYHQEIDHPTVFKNIVTCSQATWSA
jgi:hypothetical protein